MLRSKRAVLRCVGLAALCVVIVSAGVARASDLGDPRAVALKATGDAALEEGRYEEAIAAYDKAAAIEPHAVLAYNRGRALQGLGRYGAALDAIELFQRSAAPELLARVQHLDTLLKELRDHVAELQLDCPVSGARVSFGTELLGTTPLPGTVRVNAGSSKLRVQAQGYAPYEVTLDLSGGALRRVRVELVRSGTAELLVGARPQNAEIFLDGTFRGRAPFKLSLEPGTHEVLATNPGYEPVRRQLLLAAGERRAVDLSLEQTPSLLSRWWFWTGVGVVLVGTVATTVAITSERSPHGGNIAPGVVSGP